jgi:putative ABC transport system substrate-binding protein
VRRRRLIALFSGALTSSLAATCVRGSELPRIGILDPGLEHLFEAFFGGMRDLGYIEDQNVAYIRRADKQPGMLSKLAAELVRANVDVIVTGGPAAVAAAMGATSTKPIVFAALGDALATGAVTNLAHPDRNATGFSFLNTEISAKRMELLHEAIPYGHRVAVLRDRVGSGADLKPTLDAATALGLQAELLQVASPDEYEQAFRAAIAANAEAIDVLASPVFNSNREQLINLATRYRLPAIYETDEYVRAGGLMSYGPSLTDLLRRAAGYVFKLLHGAKPGDLPVEQPTRFELVINLKTAKALGLTVPQSLMQRADEVIE